MNRLQKVSCLIVGMVVATMATKVMACDSDGFWIMVSDEMRASCAARTQTQATAVAHQVARPVAQPAQPGPLVGSPAWYARRMMYHARNQFGNR